MNTINEEGLFSSVEEENKKPDRPSEQSTKLEVVSFELLKPFNIRNRLNI